ncbi:transport and Golgi organization protein 1 homolog isoform X2 [Octopus sinensis]|uniref:Transport and Golgi organization protein 1 homolog isoform X2 n=1 Tax=Octopus sinensis TaxID=2607531 RepID=A0A6P7TH96_9MOLL|nr:transport and Golgi organization protein 1 homolog isoform X2 [Octopus sinensis]
MSLADDACHTVSNSVACRNTTTTRSRITPTTAPIPLLFLLPEPQQMVTATVRPMWNIHKTDNSHRNTASGQFTRDHRKISPSPVFLNFPLLLFLLLLTISPICHVDALNKVSNLRLCADAECKETISRAIAIKRYQSKNTQFLSLIKDQVIDVKSKGGGRVPYLWGGEVDGQFGYFPISHVKEIEVLVSNPSHLVATGENYPEKKSEVESDDPEDEVDFELTDDKHGATQQDDDVEDETETTSEDNADLTPTDTTPSETNKSKQDKQAGEAESPGQSRQVDDETEISEDDNGGLATDEKTQNEGKRDSNEGKKILTKDESIDQTADEVMAAMNSLGQRSHVDNLQTTLLSNNEGYSENGRKAADIDGRQEQEKQQQWPHVMKTSPVKEFQQDMSTSASVLLSSSSDATTGHPHSATHINEATFYDNEPNSSSLGFDSAQASIVPTRSVTFDNRASKNYEQRLSSEADKFLHTSNGNVDGQGSVGYERNMETMKLTSSSGGSGTATDAPGSTIPSSWVHATVPPITGHHSDDKDDSMRGTSISVSPSTTKPFLSSSMSYDNSGGDSSSNYNDSDNVPVVDQSSERWNSIGESNNNDILANENGDANSVVDVNSNDRNAGGGVATATDPTMATMTSSPPHLDLSDAFHTSGSEFMSRKTLSVSSTSTMAAASSSSSFANGNDQKKQDDYDSHHDVDNEGTEHEDAGLKNSKESHHHHTHNGNEEFTSSASPQGDQYGDKPKQPDVQTDHGVHSRDDHHDNNNNHYHHDHSHQHLSSSMENEAAKERNENEASHSGESNDHHHRTVNQDDSGESTMSMWCRYFAAKIDIFVNYIVDMAPDSIRDIVQQETLGIPTHVVVLAPIFSLVFLIGYLLCTSCSNGSNKPKENPLSIIRNLEEKLFITTKENEILEDKVQTMCEKLTLMEEEARTHADSTGSFEVDLEQYKLENRKLRKEMETLAFQVSCLQDKLLDHSSMIEQKDDEIQSLSDELKEVSEKQEKNSYEVNTKTEEITTLQSQVQTMSDQIQHLEDRKEQLIQEVEGWDEKYRELSDSCEQSNAEYSEMQERLAFKENELEQMKSCFLQLKCLEDDCSNSEETRGDHNLVQQKIQQMLDVSEMNAMLKQSDEERDQLKHRLEIEAESRVELEDKIATLERDIETMQADKAKVVRQNHELTVLTSYLKEKELQFQRALGEQEVLKNQNITKLGSAEERVKTIEDELSNYIQQNEDLKREILKAERDFRAQIAANEKKAHENWLATRCAERELKESKHECAVLRQKLTELERRSGPVPVPLIRPLATRNVMPAGLINGPPPLMEGELHRIPLSTPPGEVPHGRSPHLGNVRDDMGLEGPGGSSSSGHRPDSRSKAHHIRSPVPPHPHHRGGPPPPRLRGGPPPPHPSPMMTAKGHGPNSGPLKKGMPQPTPPPGDAMFGPPPPPGGSSTDTHRRSPMSNKTPPPPPPGTLPPPPHHLHHLHHRPPPPRMPGEGRPPPPMNVAHGHRGPVPYNIPPRPTASQQSDSLPQSRGEKMPPRQHSQV